MKIVLPTAYVLMQENTAVILLQSFGRMSHEDIRDQIQKGGLTKITKMPETMEVSCRYKSAAAL